VFGVLSFISWRTWLTLGLAVVACAGAGVVAVRELVEPPRVEVAQVKDGDELNEATAALDAVGIAWTLADRGQTLTVDPRRSDEARGLLTGTLLPTLRRPQRPRNPEPVAAELEDGLNRMLAQTVGSDRAHVSASVTVDRTRRSSVSEGFGPRRVELAGVREGETLTGELRNGRRAYRRTVWGADRRLTARRFGVGRIERVSLALVVDRRLGRATARSLRRAVTTAAGIDRSRGDRVEVSRLRLPVTTRAAEPAAGGLAAVLNHPLALAALPYVPWAMFVAALALFASQIRRDLRTARAFS
jgi:flagellar biosynthesis/type III secretory pathway M-ring protein FliF/YscJ